MGADLGVPSEQLDVRVGLVDLDIRAYGDRAEMLIDRLQHEVASVH